MNEDPIKEEVNEVTLEDLPKEEIQEEPKESIPTETPVENKVNIGNKKNKKLILFLCLVGIIIIIVIGYLYLTNSKRQYRDNLTSLSEYFLSSKESAISKLFENDNIGVSSDVELKLSNETGLTSGIDNVKLHIDYIESKQDEKSYFNLDSLLNDKEFLNLETSMTDSKIYFMLKDIMDEYYYTDFDFNSLLANGEDIDYVTNIISDKIQSNLSKEIKDEKVTTKINGKDVDLKKISLALDEELLNKTMIDIMKAIKDDKKALEIMVKYSSTTEEETIKSIDEYISLLEEAEGNSIILTHNIYVKPFGDVVKQEIVTDFMSIEEVLYDDVREYKLISGSEEIISLKIIGSEKGKIKGKTSMQTITGTYSENSLDIKIEDTLNKTNVMTFKLDISDKEISKDKEYQYVYEFDYTLKTNNIVDFRAQLKIDNKITVGAEVPKIDVLNSKDVEIVTSEEISEIMYKIMSTEALQELYGTNQTEELYTNTDTVLDLYE